MTDAVPSDARVVVIGGGAIGASIAHHLVQAGETDVVLVEKSRLTDGATWHAAGLVGQFRTQPNLTRLMQHSVEIFETLGEQTGQDIGWNPVGSLRVAASSDRWLELQRAATAGKSFGFEMNLVDPDGAAALHPLLSTEGLFGAAFISGDGYVDPYSLTHAYAAGIRAGGGAVLEGVQVTGMARTGDRITHVETDHGPIGSDIVVNAAGIWARQVGWMAGVDLPAGVVEHQFVVTDKSDDVPDGLPTLRDPDAGFYAKPEPGALAIGGWERWTPSVSPVRGFAWDRTQFLFDPAVERFGEVFEPAARRIPLLDDIGLRTFVNGPIPISPDGEPVMGPAPGLGNLYVACGFTSGIAASGGAGRAMARWILEGDPGLDLWAFDVRRFGPIHANPHYLHDRATEAYSRYYALALPHDEPRAARGVRRSPLFGTLAAKGAVFGSKFGWERPNHFAVAGTEVAAGWTREAEAGTVGREHRAAREGVVTIDMSSFTKLEISGRRAADFLQFMAVADVAREPGQGTYTQLCNEQGGIEADVTVVRRAEDRFWVITGSALGVRDEGWLRRHARGFGDVAIRDVTTTHGVINLAGPSARSVLEKITDADVSHVGHPFMAAAEINIGYAPALAFRVTYIGELGWELYVPVEYMQYAYEQLHAAGAEHDITDIGYRAVDSLRLEKRHLAWGSDITPEDNPIEAGLGFVVDWSKDDFLGAEALAVISHEGPRRRLICLGLEDPLPVFGGEAIVRSGDFVGRTTSGNHGWTVGTSLVLGYVPAEAVDSGSFEIESFGHRTPARIIDRAPYDPDRQKVLR